MTTIKEFHQQSIDNPDAFWANEAKRIDWHKPFTKTLDFSRPPFAKWFVGGETNLCYNAVDRHAAKRPDDHALVFVSTETDTETVYSFAELKTEVMRMAAVMQHLGVGKGDRVLIYMPMIPGSDVRHAGLRAHRCDPFGRLWRLRVGVAGDAHRRCDAEADRLVRCRHARRQGGSLQAPARRRDRTRGAQAGSCADDRSRSRPRRSTRSRGATSTTRLCANASLTPRCR
jgi:hypothetical protein